MKGQELGLLFVSEPEMVQAGVLDMGSCVDVIEESLVLISEGDYLMGGPASNEHGLKIFFPENPPFPNMPAAGPDRRFMAMVGYLGGRFNVCGVKWYGSNIANPSRGLPRSIHIIVLNDPDTAKPLAIMSGNLVSAMRTGAVAGVGAKHLARKGSEIVGLIGGGVINKACLRAIVTAVPNIKKCLLFELISERAKAFVQDLEEELKIQIECVSTENEVLKHSDIVSYASSGAKKPIISEDLLKEGVLVTVTAGVGMSDSFLLNSKIVVDNIKMHLAYLQEKDEHPDGYKRVLNLPSGPLLKLIVEEKISSSEIVNLGDVISKKEIGRDNEKEKIIFFSGGMPTYDLAWSFSVFDKARKMGLGKDLVVWNEPQWF